MRRSKAKRQKAASNEKKAKQAKREPNPRPPPFLDFLQTIPAPDAPPPRVVTSARDYQLTYAMNIGKKFWNLHFTSPEDPDHDELAAIIEKKAPGATPLNFLSRPLSYLFLYTLVFYFISECTKSSTGVVSQATLTSYLSNFIFAFTLASGFDHILVNQQIKTLIKSGKLEKYGVVVRLKVKPRVTFHDGKRAIFALFNERFNGGTMRTRLMIGLALIFGLTRGPRAATLFVKAALRPDEDKETSCILYRDIKLFTVKREGKMELEADVSFENLKNSSLAPATETMRGGNIPAYNFLSYLLPLGFMAKVWNRKDILFALDVENYAELEEDERAEVPYADSCDEILSLPVFFWKGRGLSTAIFRSWIASISLWSCGFLFTMHCLRGTFCVALHDRGCSTEEMARKMTHASTASLDYYLIYKNDDARTASGKFHAAKLVDKFEEVDDEDSLDLAHASPFIQSFHDQNATLASHLALIMDDLELLGEFDKEFDEECLNEDGYDSDDESDEGDYDSRLELEKVKVEIETDAQIHVAVGRANYGSRSRPKADGMDLNDDFAV